jgi:hypothetical protein
MKLSLRRSLASPALLSALILGHGALASAQSELPGSGNQPPAPLYPSATPGMAVPEPPTAARPPSPTEEEAEAARTGAPMTPAMRARSQPPTAPQQALEPESETGRKRLFYVDISAAYTWIDLGQFRQTNLVPDIVRVSGNGYGFAGGAGVQVLFLTLGLQGEWARYPGFDLGTVGVDVGFRLPVPVVHPYFRVGVGYAWLTHLVDTTIDQSIQGVTGLSADAGLGLDIAVNDLFAFDVGFDAAVLHVRRDPLDGFGDFSSDWTPDEDGEAVGLQLTLHAGINLRF